jgi:hypothetical protein
MFNRCLFSLLVLLACLPAGTMSQISLVRNSKSAAFQHTIHTYCNIVFLDADNVLVMGENPELIDGMQIDAWDNDYFYYVLYPAGAPNSAIAQRYGKILYEHFNNILVLKTATMIESAEVIADYKLYLLNNQSYRVPNSFPGKNGISAYSQEIAQIVAKVSADTLWSNDSILGKIDRTNTASQTTKATEWVKQKFTAYCSNVYVQTWRSGTTPNVIAVKKGTVIPDEYIVICGHYDSQGIGYPGADDNGSGTCATLEACRVLSGGGYNFKRSLIFIAFSGEELGMQGSAAYCDSIKKAKVNVIAALDMDMVIYQGNGPCDVAIFTDPFAQSLMDDYIATVKQYIPGLETKKPTTSVGGSDHMSFLGKQYKAVMLIEAPNKTVGSDSYWNPNYHKKTDQLGPGYSKEMIQKITAGEIALMATKAELVVTAIKQENLTHGHTTITRVMMNNRILCFKSPSISKGHIQVCTLQGKIVATEGFSSSIANRIKLPNLAAGIYQVNLSDGQNRVSEKVCIY